jgi:CHAT domain-containing protein
MLPPRVRLRLLCLCLSVLGPAAVAAPETSPGSMTEQAPEAVASLLERAHGQQLAGAYGDAVLSLQDALALATRSGDAKDEAAVRLALGPALAACPPRTKPVRGTEDGKGDRLRDCGDRTKAAGHLDRARELARTTGDRELEATVEINRGNLFAGEQRTDEALRALVDAEMLARAAGNPMLASRALANAVRTRLDAGRPDSEVRGDLVAALGLLEVPPEPPPVDLRLHLARSAERLAARSGSGADVGRAHATLVGARNAALERGDVLSESWALGYLAALYESRGRREDALQYARRAALRAQEAGAHEALYRWNWQIGRVLAKQGQLPEAIDAYRQALRSIGEIRSELVHSYGAGLSFQNDVGPVYLELADLLLRSAPESTEKVAYEARLLDVRRTVEQLKSEELRDYFRDECVDEIEARTADLDAIASNVAVIYPVILEDRLELLLTLPSGMLRVTVPVRAETLEADVRGLRRLLEKRTTNEYLAHAQRLYDVIVRPWQAQLEQLGVNTLVFVPDGPLRTVPMGALHDGERFLIERYAVAVTPGLHLTDPKALSREQSRILLAGLSEQVDDAFGPLPFVPGELTGIQASYPGEKLLDETFRAAQIEQTLTDHDFTIVHLATHAQFGEKSSDSFVLTHDKRLSFDELGRLISFARFRDQPIELLALSACETAEGSDRAALGLAGIAVKAGARSALGTLWSVNDAASASLMTRFYEELHRPGVSKAEALRRAQRSLIGERLHRHPYYWSPFLLINNWL